MGETMQEKAVVYSKVYVNALVGAAEELSGMLNEPEMLASEPKGFDKLRKTVTGMLSLGEDSTPQQVHDSLERLGSVAQQCAGEMKGPEQEKSVHMIYAKGLDEFAKTQKEAFQKCTKNVLDPKQPINEQDLQKNMENKAVGRMKVSLDKLQKEVQGVLKEKHERTHTAAENKGPAKSTDPMGKRR